MESVPEEIKAPLAPGALAYAHLFSSGYQDPAELRADLSERKQNSTEQSRKEQSLPGHVISLQAVLVPTVIQDTGLCSGL